jgi:hypothetical protein
LRRFRKGIAALLGLGVALSAGVASAQSDSADTEANYTPVERFEPVPASAACEGAPGGRASQPFAIPPGYEQQVVAEETDPIAPANDPAGSEDLWDMNTQNEFGKDEGRFVYRTHEVGAAANAGDPPRAPGGAQVTVTDLQTGITHNLAERNDWERFDGIAWTPWGTVIAAEEVIVASGPDPQVPQATAGLVYELFVDRKDPWKLDPSREPITAPQDGTQDFTQDGIRARPAVGSKSHEGLRFDEDLNLYGIAETRGQTVAGQTGGLFRFIPERNNEEALAFGRLQVFQADGQASYGPGRWIDLDPAQAQINADAEAEQKQASEYQRPEDVETDESTGIDKNNNGETLYVAITEGAEMGVLAMDLNNPDRPVAYRYVGANAGNTTSEFQSPDNLALDREGNLAITEDPSTPPEADVWVAAPPKSDEDTPAVTVQRFASLKDCEAEPTGVYFTLKGTEKWTKHGPLAGKVTGESLLVNRQHSEQGTLADQLVSFDPAG